MGDLAQKIPSLDDAGDILLVFSSTILRLTNSSSKTLFKLAHYGYQLQAFIPVPKRILNFNVIY